MAVLRITAPTVQPISLSEAKAHIRDVDDDENDLIELYIAAAVDNLDGPGGWLGRALMSQTLEVRLADFPARGVRLPYPPLIEVESVKYLDQFGDLQTLSGDAYIVSNVGAEVPGLVSLAAGYTWPVVALSPEAVLVRYRAGHVDTIPSPAVGEVPAAIKAGILKIVADLYAIRETEIIGTNIVRSRAAEELLLPKRIPYFA